MAKPHLDHEARLEIAFQHLRVAPLHRATPRIRAAIRESINGGGASGDPHAYHETLTLVWTRLVAARLGDPTRAHDFAAFLSHHPELRNPETALLYYSDERIASERARREFVLPDREPLPRPTLEVSS